METLQMIAFKGTLAKRLARRRTIRRYQSWAGVCSLVGLTLLPTSGFAAILSTENDMQRLNQELGVRALVYSVRPSTAARILREESAGEWYATPDDGPKALTIKRELHVGTTPFRNDIHLLLEIAREGHLPLRRGPAE